MLRRPILLPARRYFDSVVQGPQGTAGLGRTLNQDSFALEIEQVRPGKPTPDTPCASLPWFDACYPARGRTRRTPSHTLPHAPRFNAEQEGNFRLHEAMSAIIYNGTVYFNFAHEDLERCELYNHINFRRAIALAIRRAGGQRPPVPRSVHAVADAGGG